MRPDETRYAQISREMINSGDWIVPRLNNLRYFEKPIMGYWFNSLSMLIFGENNFGIRFASALSAGLTALVIFFLCKKQVGDKGGFMAALIYLLCAEIYMVGTFSVLDSMLTLTLTMSAAFFFFAFHSQSMKKRYMFLALFGTSVGCSFLIKGFLAFVVAGMTAGFYLLWEFSKNRFELWKKHSPGHNIKHAILQFLTILVPLLIIILPWSIMIHLKEPDYWRYFVMEEHVKRFMSKHAQHVKPFFFYVPVLLIGMLPWTLLLPLPISKWRSYKLNTPLIKYTFIWSLLPFLFFSTSKGKLATYMLPVIPPLTILFTFGLEEFFKQDNKALKWLHFVSKLFLCLIPVTIVAVTVLQFTGIPGTETESGSRLLIFNNQTEWMKYSFAFFGLAAWAFCLFKLLKTTDIRKKFYYFMSGPALIFIIFIVCLPNLARKYTAPGDFLLANSNGVSKDTVIVSDHSMSRSACWFFNRNDIYLVFSANELTYGINYDDESKKRLLKDADFKTMTKKHKGNLVLILTKKHYLEYIEEEKYLPPPEKVVIKGKYAFCKY